MSDMPRPHDDDVAKLLSGYYQEVAMETTFRDRLLADTRRIVSSRPRRRVTRLALGIAAAAAAAFACVLIWQMSRPSPLVTPPHSAALSTPHPGVALAPTPEEPISRAGVAPSGTPGTTSRAVAGGVKPTPAQAFLTVVVARQPATTGKGAALKVGLRLAAGTVKTGPGGRVTLVTKQGSEFALNEKSELAITSPNSSRLVGGEVYCRSRAGEVKHLATPGGEIRLLGTALDAAMKAQRAVAVTVLKGRVELVNAHGQVQVEAGKQALLVASRRPEAGTAADIFAATAWYDGRGAILSDFGDISYTIRRGDMFTEIWTMKADGSGKRHVKSFLGYGQAPGSWLPGEQRLMLSTHSLLWTTPNFTTHRADAGAGHPIVGGRAWVVNAATGEDMPFELPAGYDPLYMSLSPDGERLAFCGRYQPDPKSQEGMEGGVFVYDLATGQVKKVLNGWIKTPVAWGPDSRFLAASTGEGYGTNYPLVVVDVDTGHVTDLGVQGAGPAFSPDGTRLAYCGGFRRSGSWSMGVPTSGSIWVISLEPGSKPTRISPEGEGALQPHWSPDGTKVLYRLDYWPESKPGERTSPGYAICSARVDGTGVTEIFHEQPSGDNGALQAASWGPSGGDVYLSTNKGVLVVSADGSRQARSLGGNVADSPLSPEEQTETDAAVSAVREGIFQYALGNVRAYEGKPRDSQRAFAAAADTFAALPYDEPLVGFSINDVMGYADKAAELGSRRIAEILDQSCQERMDHYLSVLLTQYAAAKGEFPPNLVALQEYSLTSGWGINWISNRDTEWVKMMFRCPSGGDYLYTPPATGQSPEMGEVLVTCRSHPAHRIIWTKEMAQELEWRRGVAAQQAADKDPKIKALQQKAEMTAQMVGHAAQGTWDDVVKARLDVLAANPRDPLSREMVGRFYTRWGRFDEALHYLSGSGGGWGELYAAFCLDALGQREKALAIYAQYAKGDPGWVGTQWAKLGMERPTWPRDLAIPAEPGEVRIMPDSHWHATATATVIPGSPHLTGRPELAIDGDRTTSWQTSGGDSGQTPGEWFKLEFDTPLVVTRIVLDHYGEKSIYTNNWARGLEAEVTSDGTTWHKVDVSPGAIFQPSTVRLEPAQAVKAIKFTTTATHDPEWWGIYEIFVFGSAK